MMIKKIVEQQPRAVRNFVCLSEIQFSELGEAKDAIKKYSASGVSY